MDRETIKRYVINICCIFALVSIVIFCIIYSRVNFSNGIKNNLTETESNEGQEDAVNDVSEEGYEDIELCLPVSDSICQNVKLYRQGENCCFFLPSYCDLDSLIINFDEEIYDVSVNDKALHSGDKINGYYDDSARIEIKKDNVQRQYNLCIMKSSNLPAIFISTANGTMDFINQKKTNTEPGELICINEDGSIENSGILDEIKLHGNTSTTPHKKTYQISFSSDQGLLSMAPAVKWILQANAYDGSFMRNKLVYDIARQMGLRYAIEAEYADVWFNDEYAGNYLICEKVETGKNRVDITVPNIENNDEYSELWRMAEVMDEEGCRYYNFAEEPDYETGYLIEANNIIVGSDNLRINDEDCYFTSDYGIYEVKSPKKVSKNQLDYIRGYMMEVERLIEDCDSAEKYECLKEYIDTDSFAIMYILDILTNNVDANNYSTFYYIDSDKDETKLYAGPVWDYDLAFGNDTRGKFINLNGFDNGLCEELIKNEQFKNEVVNMFNIRMTAISEDYVDGFWQYEYNYIKDSVKMDKACYKRTWIDWPNPSYTTFDEEREYLKYYYDNRFALVKEMLNNNELFSDVVFMNGNRGRTCYVRNGEILPYEIMNYVESLYGCKGWSIDEGVSYEYGRPVFGDMILHAKH